MDLELIKKARRLRNNIPIRSMVRETRLSIDSLIYPIFIREEINVKEEIASTSGQYRYSVDRLGKY